MVIPPLGTGSGGRKIRHRDLLLVAGAPVSPVEEKETEDRPLSPACLPVAEKETEDRPLSPSVSYISMVTW